MNKKVPNVDLVPPSEQKSMYLPTARRHGITVVSPVVSPARLDLAATFTSKQRKASKCTREEEKVKKRRKKISNWTSLAGQLSES